MSKIVGKIIVGCLAIFAVCSIVFAEEMPIYQGSSWGQVGNMSPEENNNIIGVIHAEQGLVAWRNDAGNTTIVPFIDGTVTYDTKGYNWNRNLVARAGIKLEQAIPYGTVAFRGGEAYEYCCQSGDLAVAPFTSLDYWLGWGYGTQFPGSSFGIAGYGLSPVENDNFSMMINVAQGFFAVKAFCGDIIPFAEMSLARDTEGYDWNNKYSLGAGVKYKINPIEVGVRYLRDNRVISGISSDAVCLFASYWLGW